MNEFNRLAELPGSPQEQGWIEERLETLSVRESYSLAAILMKTPPRDAKEAVECLQSLDEYKVRFPAGSYEQLGKLYLQQINKIPEGVLPYVNLERLGQQYEDKHPGLFIGNCYVAFPKESRAVQHQENEPLPLRDDDWTVKLKLASPAVPEGVWLRMPDFSELDPRDGVEMRLVLDELKVQSLSDCTPLEVRCILPEVRNLLKQYDSLEALIGDGDYLGYVMDERGQGEPHWREKFAAALEYEDCRTLRFALDISQNLRCYEWISQEGLADFAANYLRTEGVPDELIQSGTIDLNGYAEDLLETSGYMQASGETGYLIRNGREFVRDFTAPEQGSMTMQ